jgi:hypothetical protein
MKALFLSFKDLSVVTECEIGDYSVFINLLSPQSSNLEVLNGEKVGEGQVCIMPLKANHYFLGIVNKVTVDRSTNKRTVSVKDFSSLLNTPVPVTTGTSQNLSNLLITKVNWINYDSNSSENISWLSFDSVDITGNTPSWDSDNPINCLDMLKDLMSVSNLGVKFIYNNANTPITITMRVINRGDSKTIVNLGSEFVSDVSASNDSKEAYNVLQLNPKTDNYVSTQKFYYYLLNDGTITTDYSASGRIFPIKKQVIYYTDTDVSNGTLATTAKSELTPTFLSHEITFTMRIEDISIDSIKDFIKNAYCGQRVRLYNVPGESSYVDSEISQMKFTRDGRITFTCGYSRSSLTDMLNLQKTSTKVTPIVYHTIVKTATGSQTKTLKWSKDVCGSYTYSFTVYFNSNCKVVSTDTEVSSSTNPTYITKTIAIGTGQVVFTFDVTTQAVTTGAYQSVTITGKVIYSYQTT